MFRTLIATMILAASPVLAESTLAIAGSTTGLYMSRDRGMVWDKNTALGDVSIRAVAVDRSDLGRLYVATFDALLFSGDGGVSWSSAEFPQPANIQKLIAGKAGVAFALADHVVWSSTDGGKHWTAELGIPTGVLDVAVDASDPPVVYASAMSGIYTKSGGSAWMGLPGSTVAGRIIADPDAGGSLFRSSDVVVARTADGGGTWTNLPEVPALTAVAASGGGFTGDFEVDATFSVVALAPGQVDTEVIALGVVCITWDGRTFPCSSGIVAGRNGGWRATSSLNGLMQPVTMAADRSSNIVLVGGTSDRGPGLCRSNFAGELWTPISGFDGVSVNAIAIATVDVEPFSQVYVGTNEGLFSSADRGETWQSDQAVGKTEVFAIAVDQAGSGLILASTSYGLFRSTDAGASWEKSELPDEVTASVIVIDTKEDGRAYLVDRNGTRTNRLRLWTSEDRGRSWQQVAGQPEGILDVALDSRTTPSIVYVAGRFGVQKSTDKALTWTWLPRTWYSRFLRLGEPAGTIYLDGEEGVMKSTNDGETWEFLGPPIRILADPPPSQGLLWEWIEVDALAIGSGRNDTLVAGCVSYFAEFVSFGPDISLQAVITLDAEGWHVFQTPGRPCYAAAVDPRAAGLVYAGGAELRRSLDGGRSWSPAPGFGNPVVNTIATGPLRTRDRRP